MILYNKSWKKMIDLKIKKKYLKEIAGIRYTTITKLLKNGPVSMGVIVKIRFAFKCNIGESVDVMICED